MRPLQRSRRRYRFFDFGCTRNSRPGVARSSVVTELFAKVIEVLRMRICDGVRGFEGNGPVACANFLNADDPEFEELLPIA